MAAAPRATGRAARWAREEPPSGQSQDQALAELNRRWQACMDEVYRRLDRGDLSAADKVNTTLSRSNAPGR